jgi:hypothetical protein
MMLQHLAALLRLIDLNFQVQCGQCDRGHEGHGHEIRIRNTKSLFFRIARVTWDKIRIKYIE